MFQRTCRAVIATALGFVMMFAISGVAAQDVRTNYQPGVDFSKFHTYKWVTVPNTKYPNQIVDGQIKSAIDSQLQTKGLTKTDDEKADLYVSYQAAVNQQTQWNTYGMGGGWRTGRMATAQPSTINTGTLVLDMYDPATKQLVWTGRATKTLNPSKDQEKNQEKLNKAMAKLLKDYPPKRS